MSNIQPLILDLLEWLDKEPQPYLAVMEAWRTSCPRLPVWEEANRRRFVRREREAGQPLAIVITAAGMDHLRSHRRAVEGW